MHSRDQNLIFQYNRGDLIGPQTKGNQLILELGATKQDWKKIKRPSGRDANTFFRLKKTLQPTLRTRIIKDFEPLSRVIGSLPTTKKERQAAAVVSSIQGILTALRNFMSSPVKDVLGNTVLDPITNLPVIQVRTITEILDVSHQALNTVMNQNNIVMSPAFQIIVNSLTVASVVAVLETLSRIVAVRPNMSQVDKNIIFKNEILVKRINTDDEINANSRIAKSIPEAMSEQKTTNGDWRGVYPDKWIRPNQWKEILADPEGRLKSALMHFINAREDASDAKLRTVLGKRLSYLSVGTLTRMMGRQFGLEGGSAFLNLETLAFTPPQNVPEGERVIPQPLL